MAQTTMRRNLSNAQISNHPCEHEEVERDSFGHLSCIICRTSFESAELSTLR